MTSASNFTKTPVFLSPAYQPHGKYHQYRPQPSITTSFFPSRASSIFSYNEELEPLWAEDTITQVTKKLLSLEPPAPRRSLRLAAKNGQRRPINSARTPSNHHKRSQCGSTGPSCYRCRTGPTSCCCTTRRRAKIQGICKNSRRL